MTWHILNSFRVRYVTKPVVVSLLLFAFALCAYGEESLSARAVQIMEQHCVRCHNADKSRGGLDLSTREGALLGGATSDAVVILQPDKSAIYRRVLAGTMPPDRDGRKLNAAELATLRDWIQAGAAWPENVAKPRVDAPPPAILNDLPLPQPNRSPTSEPTIPLSCYERCRPVQYFCFPLRRRKN